MRFEPHFGARQCLCQGWGGPSWAGRFGCCSRWEETNQGAGTELLSPSSEAPSSGLFLFFGAQGFLGGILPDPALPQALGTAW